MKEPMQRTFIECIQVYIKNDISSSFLLAFSLSHSVSSSKTTAISFNSQMIKTELFFLAFENICIVHECHKIGEDKMKTGGRREKCTHVACCAFL